MRLGLDFRTWYHEFGFVLILALSPQEHSAMLLGKGGALESTRKANQVLQDIALGQAGVLV